MKTRYQKTRESLQENASKIERFANMAFTDNSANVREMISQQYFIDGAKDPEIQKTVRMAEVQYLKSSQLYALKLKAATQASRRDRHSIRGARVTGDTQGESSWMKKIRN
ncbi:uncharacterized protein TNCV_2637871 [Trichonephila clavipes]|nr:uncharacterized protein TNCV_2637871 [Trichonephila clavipes]